MAIPDDIKCPELEAFHEHIYDPSFKYPCGEKHYKVLMEEYPRVGHTISKQRSTGPCLPIQPYARCRTRPRPGTRPN